MFPFPAISLGDASGAPGTSLHGLRIYYFSLLISAYLRFLSVSSPMSFTGVSGASTALFGGY